MSTSHHRQRVAAGLFLVSLLLTFTAQADRIRELQLQAIESKTAPWGYWGSKPDVYSDWTNHSNRLIPIYTFGIGLDAMQGENSAYRNPKRLKEIYGRLPDRTFNPSALYLDQTDVYQLQKQAIADGKKYIILMVFDGMDWQTTQAAAVYAAQSVEYTSGRGRGLHFQEYRGANITDFGFFASSPHNNGTDVDVNAQTVANPGGVKRGGYSAALGGTEPWSRPSDRRYLIGRNKRYPHVVTDSAASATSMTAGIKTYNSSINIAHDGRQVETLAHRLQNEGFAIGVVTSVPLSHATPACAYAHNVTRNDYQDLTRDLIGRRSISHRVRPLPGVDVLIGCGWDQTSDDDSEKQGHNYVPGNKYLTESDLRAVDIANGGKYRIARRTSGHSGTQVLEDAAKLAAREGNRLLGFFGGNHLPYRTADGQYNPTRGDGKAEIYSDEHIAENPTLADMTQAALRVLETNEQGFWLLLESGDVDWANHDNNLDNSIGAVLSGDDAFQEVVKWIEARNAWEQTAFIVTADHGHYLNLTDPTVLIHPTQ